LRRFSVLCYGKQQTLEDMREEKSKIYAQVKENIISRDSKLYNLNFFRYIPKEVYDSSNNKLEKSRSLKTTKPKPLKKTKSKRRPAKSKRRPAKSKRRPAKSKRRHAKSKRRHAKSKKNKKNKKKYNIAYY
jgi:hypothetical protein